MSVLVTINLHGTRIDFERDVTAAVSFDDDRNEVIRQCLPVLDGIREDLARMVEKTPPLSAGTDRYGVVKPLVKDGHDEHNPGGLQ